MLSRNYSITLNKKIGRIDQCSLVESSTEIMSTVTSHQLAHIKCCTVKRYTFYSPKIGLVLYLLVHTNDGTNPQIRESSCYILGNCKHLQMNSNKNHMMIHCMTHNRAGQKYISKNKIPNVKIAQGWSRRNSKQVYKYKHCPGKHCH